MAKFSRRAASSPQSMQRQGGPAPAASFSDVTGDGAAKGRAAEKHGCAVEGLATPKSECGCAGASGAHQNLVSSCSVPQPLRSARAESQMPGMQRVGRDISLPPRVQLYCSDTDPDDPCTLVAAPINETAPVGSGPGPGPTEFPHLQGEVNRQAFLYLRVKVSSYLVRTFTHSTGLECLGGDPSMPLRDPMTGLLRDGADPFSDFRRVLYTFPLTGFAAPFGAPRYCGFRFTCRGLIAKHFADWSFLALGDWPYYPASTGPCNLPHTDRVNTSHGWPYRIRPLSEADDGSDLPVEYTDCVNGADVLGRFGSGPMDLLDAPSGGPGRLVNPGLFDVDRDLDLAWSFISPEVQAYWQVGLATLSRVRGGPEWVPPPDPDWVLPGYKLTVDFLMMNFTTQLLTLGAGGRPRSPMCGAARG